MDLMGTFIHNGLERWTPSNVLSKQLPEEVCKHPSIFKRVFEIKFTNKVKGTLVWNQANVESKTKVDVSSIASEADSTMKHERIRHHLRKRQVAK